MSKWTEFDMDNRVTTILSAVPINNPGGHAFGRPFLTAYQVAIDFERRWPEVVAEIGKPVGGSGSGQHDTLAQYIANQLSRHIRDAQNDHPIEGAFMSNRDVQEFVFDAVDGSTVVSSSAGGRADLSMYRLR